MPQIRKINVLEMHSNGTRTESLINQYLKGIKVINENIDCTEF